MPEVRKPSDFSQTSERSVPLGDQVGPLVQLYTHFGPRPSFPSRRSTRTQGTWQFASAAVLKNPGLPPARKLTDDIESFLHVMMHTAIAYTPNDMTPDGRGNYLFDVFNEATVDSGHIVGGASKALYLSADHYVPEKFQTRSPLGDLLRTLARAIGVRYQPPPVAEMRANAMHTLAELDDKADADYIDSLISRQYYADIKRIETSDWLRETLRAAVADCTKWPEAERASRQPITSEVVIEEGRQYARYLTRLIDYDYVQAEIYHPTPDASSKRQLASASDDEETKPRKIPRHF
ncbi:hypothetical protein BV22DRAFT_1120759 [Leucogyrophana mollusca]|uniref:Uncharacterized protein n=1 Tax=Leucogyrophana mollusca TaxID=85980 RepID=A0ACB8BCM4_9AGAM|nr:hypothetical protein BV22DRAFT_1120759 [Leucogyrophana mollusca]